MHTIILTFLYFWYLFIFYIKCVIFTEIYIHTTQLNFWFYSIFFLIIIINFIFSIHSRNNVKLYLYVIYWFLIYYEIYCNYQQKLQFLIFSKLYIKKNGTPYMSIFVRTSVKVFFSQEPPKTSVWSNTKYSFVNHPVLLGKM